MGLRLGWRGEGREGWELERDAPREGRSLELGPESNLGRLVESRREDSAIFLFGGGTPEIGWTVLGREEMSKGRVPNGSDDRAGSSSSVVVDSWGITIILGGLPKASNGEKEFPRQRQMKKKSDDAKRKDFDSPSFELRGRLARLEVPPVSSFE